MLFSPFSILKGVLTGTRALEMLVMFSLGVSHWAVVKGLLNGEIRAMSTREENIFF